MTGLFYNLGLWTDKLIGWHFKGSYIFSNFKAYGAYDTPVFIAYLSIIPSLAYFLIQSETSFFLAHRRFFDSISKERLQNILTYKRDLIVILKKSLFRLFLIQLVASSIGFFAAGFIAPVFGITGPSVLFMRLLFYAAGGQVMFLYVIIFLMYFDLSKTGFYIVLLFFCLNFIFNYANMIWPVVPMGAPYLAAIVISLCYGLYLLYSSTKDIEYTIFMNQED